MTVSSSPAWFPSVLSSLVDGHNLPVERMRLVMESLLRGECGEAEIAALLIALRMKGETADELAAAAMVMREHCEPFEIDNLDVLDTCGTGGDSSGTFNISTATAFVVAGAGVRVVKHGNRAISSSSGSADVLTELGVEISTEVKQAKRCLETVGMAFCLAPLYHPALRHVGQVRRRLGIRTLFNCLGPLANPARAPYQLLGVGRSEWLDRMAGALACLGVRKAFLVHAHDGLDEVSLSAPTDVRVVCGTEVAHCVWTPKDFGLEACALTDLKVSTAAESAGVIRSILQGVPGPATRVVLANAAAALLVAGCVSDLSQGVERASQAIRSGRAQAVLDGLIEQTRPQKLNS